jgi:hypothetical protein
MRQHDIYP